MLETNGLRVLHVVASRQRRGAEVFAADLVDELAAAGVEQQVVALRDNEGDVLAFNAPTSILRVAPFGPLRIDFAAILRLRALVGRWDGEILQAHGGEALKYSVPAALGTKSILSYRRIGSSPPGTLRQIRMAGHRRLVRRARVVIAVSESARHEAVRQFGVSEQRAIRIPNGVSVERALPSRLRHEVRRGLGFHESVEIVVSVGALNWEKDPLAQIAVFERVAQTRPRAVLLMIGSGALECDTRREVLQKGLEGRVYFLGTRVDIADILGASDVLLLASKTEGMPGVVIEAGIAGTPVAAYSLSGVPEVVVDGETGLLARPRDTDALAARVIDLLADANLRTRMGRAAHERCVGHFGIVTVAARYLDVYRQLTGANGHTVRLEAAK